MYLKINIYIHLTPFMFVSIFSIRPWLTGAVCHLSGPGQLFGCIILIYIYIFIFRYTYIYITFIRKNSIFIFAFIELEPTHHTLGFCLPQNNPIETRTF